jgi:hypothetical protein
MPLDECRIIELPKIQDRRGNLTFVEVERHVPFEIKRVYYLYDVPGGAARAAHAHKSLHQLMIAMSGSFDVTLEGRGRINRETAWPGEQRSAARGGVKHERRLASEAAGRPVRQDVGWRAHLRRDVRVVEPADVLATPPASAVEVRWAGGAGARGG